MTKRKASSTTSDWRVYPPAICTAAKLREWARWLRKVAPPPRPVKIRRVPRSRLEGAAGWTYAGRRKSYFVIELADNLSFGEIQDALIHEWAHVLTWNDAVAGLSTDHDEVWSARHGQIYRAFHVIETEGV